MNRKLIPMTRIIVHVAASALLIILPLFAAGVSGHDPHADSSLCRGGFEWSIGQR